MKPARARDAAAQVVAHAGHVCQVADAAAAATVAAAVGGVERRGLR